MTQENRYLVRDLIALGRHLEREANAIGKSEAGVGFTDALVLGAIRVQVGGRAHPSDLVYRLLQTRPAVSAALRRLEDAGYVSREPSQEDRRSVWDVITREGSDAAERLTDRLDQWADETVASISEEERTTLRSMLGRIGI